MIFIIGWGFAESQILKKWKWLYLLNWVKYFDRLLLKHWYWQDLAQEIAKCHFSSVKVLPSSKFWKSENGPISWTEWNISWIEWTFSIQQNADQNKHNLKKVNQSWRLAFRVCLIIKHHQTVCEDFVTSLFVKILPPDSSRKMSILLNYLEYFDKLLHKHWHWQDLAQETAKWHLSSVKALPRSKFWKLKMVLSLDLSGRFRWKFAYTLKLTRCSSRDCKTTFIVGWSFAELRILKKWKWPYILNWVEYCDEILHTQ